MRDKDDGTEKAAQLRWKAEEIAQRKGGPSSRERGPLSPEEARETIHELQVHQIELKMQNEELRRIQAELDAARAHYFDLYDLAPVGYCIISLDGLIQEINLTAVTLLGAPRSTLIKQPISRFILKEDQDIYYLHRKQLFGSNEPRACELRMVKMDGKAFWVRLTSTPSSSGRDGEGAPVSRLVLSDITDRKQAEEEKAKLQEQLKNSPNSRQATLDRRLKTATLKGSEPDGSPREQNG
jgi:PAS domain S-box-containing protein